MDGEKGTEGTSSLSNAEIQVKATELGAKFLNAAVEFFGVDEEAEPTPEQILITILAAQKLARAMGE